MKRSMVALLSAVLALVITTSLAVAAPPPENSPWESTGFRCTTHKEEPGTIYLNTHSDRERCIAS